MSARGVVAGIDVGTTKIELVVYREDGTPLSRLVKPNRTLSDGVRAEQDAVSILATVRGFIGEARRLGARCVGLAVYRGSLIVWDKAGTPATRVVTWMDLRPHTLWRRLPLSLRLASRLPRIGVAFSPESTATRLASLIAERPEIRAGLERGSLLAWNLDAYLAYTLTGAYVADSATAALTGLIHPRDLKPLGIVFRLARLPRLRLPRLLNHEGFEPIPLKGGGYLASLIGDQQAASVSLNCLSEGCLKVSLGTGLFLDLSTGGRLVLSPGGGLLPLLLYKPRGRGAVYAVEGYTPGLGKTVEWFADNLLGGDYGLLDRAATASVRIPLVVPFMWGSRTPRLLRGTAGILGLVQGLDRLSLASGLAHSIAATVALVERAIEERVARPDRIIVTGGLSRLKGLLELIAAYLDRRVWLARVPGSSSALGAAVLAASNCGLHFEANIELEEVEPRRAEALIEPRELARAAKGLEDLLKSLSTQWGRGRPRHG